ncbi:MAG: SDR family NAD(P)-dependent oxidoreductase [Rickettsiales bacterium]
MSQTQDLLGKNAVITGSTQGIGLTVAREMAARGSNVMFNGLFFDRKEGDAIVQTAAEQQQEFEATTLAELKAAYPNQHFSLHTADVTNKEQVEAMMAETAALGGLSCIDVLVNNAGIHPPSVQKPLGAFDEGAARKLMDVNYWGAVGCAQAAIAHMPEDSGTIVNMSSVHGHVGSIARIPYCAAKHALEGFTRSLAGEHPEKTIVTVAPAFVKTELALAPVRLTANALAEKHNIPNDEAYKIAEAWRLQNQNGKWIEETEIAQACADIAAGHSPVPSGLSVKLDNGYIDNAVNGCMQWKTPDEVAESYLTGEWPPQAAAKPWAARATRQLDDVAEHRL